MAEATARVRQQHPEFVFMAEVYWDLEYALQQQGFDYTYDKRLYDRLHAQDAGAVLGHLHADAVSGGKTFDDLHEVESAVLYPNGTIYMKGGASRDSARLNEIVSQLQIIRQQLADLRTQ